MLAPCEYPTRAKDCSGHAVAREVRREMMSLVPWDPPVMMEEEAGYCWVSVDVVVERDWHGGKG